MFEIVAWGGQVELGYAGSTGLYFLGQPDKPL